jgi:hypothetical protein
MHFYATLRSAEICGWCLAEAAFDPDLPKAIGPTPGWK